MRITAFVFGVLGGIAALVAAVVVLTAAGVGGLFEVPNAGAAAWAGVATLLAALVGIVGAVVVVGRPVLGGILLIISALGGLAFALLAYLIPALLLLTGGIIGVMTPRETTVVAYHG